MAASSRWNDAIVASSRCFFQLNDGEQLYARSLPGNCACTASANCAASSRSGVDVSHQRTSAYGAYASARAIGASIPGVMRKKPSDVRSPVDELAVLLVDVARQERRRERVGAGDENRRDVEDVRGEAGRDERANELARGHENLPAEVPALLLRRELVLEVDTCGACLDERLHQLERVEGPPNPASASATIGASQYVPFFPSAESI